MNIQFFGDLSLDGVYCEPQQHLPLKENLSWLSKELGPSDFRVINWESPLWGNGEINHLKSPRLCTTIEAAETIIPLKVDVALLANNHVYDNGLSGFKNTLDFFKRNNIDFVGASEMHEKVKKSILLEKNGIKIGLLNYVSKETNPKLPDDAKINLSFFNMDEVEQDIKALKGSVNFIVLQIHWGEIELMRVPSPSQRKIARHLIEAGANVIIGHHVHCLQGWEKWKGGVICYSLGNFIFGTHLTLPGQVHSSRTKDSRRIAVPDISFSNTGVDISWKYFFKKRNSLLIESDREDLVRNFHQSLCTALKYSDYRLQKAYKKERKLMAVRSFIDKNGGLINAFASIGIKQLKLLKKI